MNTIIEKIRAEVKRRIKSWQTRGEHSPEGQGKDTCVSRVTELTDLLSFLDTLQEQPVMIEWTGNNLKEVIEFTGKSPRFDEWFKTWDEYESYVHSHGNIFKLFNEDGTHLEVPVGAWIVKTPDGRNVPSTFLYQEQPVCEGLEEEIKRYYEDMDGDCRYAQTARHFAKWQREQMMKEAVEIGETNIYWEADGDRAFPTFDPPVDDLLSPDIISQKFEDGQKVRIIIVKED